MRKIELKPLDGKNPKVASGARKLVILIPGIGSSHKHWSLLLNRLQNESGYTPAEADWMAFDHGIKPWTLGNLRPAFLTDPSNPRNLEVLCRQLCLTINELWIWHKGYDEVVLIGHSFGGLIARRIYLLAAGAVPAQDDYEFPWGKRVSRIVLFAAVNRGFNLNRLNWYLNALAWLLRTFFRRMFYFEDVLLGSDFVSNVRIDWIRHFRIMDEQHAHYFDQSNDNGPSVPLIVQYLGDTDGVLNQEDSKDVMAFSYAQYRQVADANHSNLYRLEEKFTAHPDRRYEVLKEAFVEKPEKMSTDSIFRPTRSSIEHVIMILHGIRDSNVDAWVEGLKGKIKELKRTDVKASAPTYGYFSALRFSLPAVRKKNIPIFTDLYIEELVENPEADFNIIAHSNGTYMLGHSLERIKGMRFTNVVLAGSALPQKFRWGSLMDADKKNRRQVVRVLNERANHDLPIGFLCSALQGLGMEDIGPAGFAGFINVDSTGKDIHEDAYIKGGHSQALMPKNQSRLIAFALGGNPPPPEQPDWTQKRPFFFGLFSGVAPYLAWVIILALGWGIAVFVFPGWVFNPKHAIEALAGFLVILVILDTF